MRPSSGVTIALEPPGIEIPPWVRDLASFRRWALSDDLPREGRIDYLAGRIEVDMTAEELNTHSSAKTAISAALCLAIDYEDRGVVYVDRTRYSSPQADLSCEPDVLVLLFDSIARGRVRAIPRHEGRG